jgi:glycosyltransferase involved in cell wall biosynthesis
MTDVAAAVVNYGTPDLTRAAVWSLRSLYPALPVLVVENGSPDDSKARLAALAAEAGGVTLLTPGENLHHGPGLDLAIRRTAAPWVLVFDSDCVAYRGGFLEAMRAAADAEPAAYMVGQRHHVDDGGFDVPPGAAGAHPYVHPKCALVRREAYLALPPFERHGAPCLANERAAAREGLALVDFPVRDYVLHLGEGTVRRYGYGLGAAGRLARLRRLLRR